MREVMEDENEARIRRRIKERVMKELEQIKEKFYEKMDSARGEHGRQELEAFIGKLNVAREFVCNG